MTDIRTALRSLAAMALVFGFSPVAMAQDADAAQALIRKSECLKCHAVDKKKDGPSFKETAGKYKGKADAPQKLFTHLTTRPKIKVDDKEEEHTTLKGAKDEDVRNVVQWILSR
jgi:cytochrome c